MLITDISTRVVDAGDRDWVFVRVGTDAGIVGWGEATSSRCSSVRIPDRSNDAGRR